MAIRVLIVDDNRTNLYMLEALLKGNGFEVLSAENGREALEKARLTPPDLIVTDILMPVMDGYALCREWKSDDTLKQIPFVFYTATYTEPKDESFGLGLGADRFVTKPQDFDALIAILREVLEESRDGQKAEKPLDEEMEFLRQHNKALFKKLEKKMLELETANQRLKASEERYRLSFENVTDVICTIGSDLVVSGMSPSIKRLMGLKPEDFIGKSITIWEEFLTRESFNQIMENIHRILEGEIIPSTTYEFVLNNGNTAYGEVSGAPLVRDGEIIGLISVARDITERKRAEEALQTAHTRRQELEFIVNHSPAVVWLWKAAPGWPVEYVSDNVIRYGYSPDDFTSGRIKFASIVHPEDLSRVGDEVEQYTHEGKTEFLQEYRILTKSGDIHWTDDRTWVRFGPDGSITHYQGIAVDITDRKRAEEALRESEKKYRELYDFLPIPVYEMDFTANMTSVNRAIYETFRGTEEDLKGGFNAWQLLSPEEVDKSAKNIERLLKGEEIEGTEYTFKRLDGSTFPAIVISSVIYSHDQPVGLRGAVIDITHRKEAEEALRESERKYRFLTEEMTDIVWMADMDLRTTYVSPSVQTVLGFSQEERMSQSVTEQLTPDSLSFGLDAMARELALEEEGQGDPERSATLVLEYYHKDGSTRWMETVMRGIRNDQGILIGLHGVSRDITARRQAEERLQETLDRLRKAVETTIHVIVSTIEARDPYTAGHQVRVADLVQAIATEMELPQEMINGLFMVGSIHDIGKISVPAEILAKPAQLTETEFAMVKEHPRRGYEILKDVEADWPLAEIIYQHHERMDGSGYPRGLKGEKILFEARILAVADVVEAMSSHRPYRASLGIEAALDEVAKNRGTLYDPEVVDVCLRLFREKGYKFG